jgi:5-(aminomethyl)-3-furanmethanol phosphate kinase
LGTTPTADVVIKVGGALVRDPDAFTAATANLGAVRHDLRIVLVPGGGPFADAVRDVDRTLGLGSDAAHWMAVLGMEQYAHLLGERIPGAIVIGDPAQLADAWHAGRVPVLAPYQWLRHADPVPHSWDATSDSIAAWIAVTLRAAHLVLIKPAPGAPHDVTDAHFGTILGAASSAPCVSVCTAQTLARVMGSLRLPAV